MNTPIVGSPAALTSVASGNNPATYAAVSTPSLVTLVPGGSGQGQITYEGSFGNTSVVRVNSGGGSAVVVVPANQPLTVSAVLGTGASPNISVTRYTLNH